MTHAIIQQCHDALVEANNAHELSTFESAICAAAPDWWDAEDDEESDVDEGFASYNDFLNYMYR